MYSTFFSTPLHHLKNFHLPNNASHKLKNCISIQRLFCFVRSLNDSRFDFRTWSAPQKCCLKLPAQARCHCFNQETLGPHLRKSPTSLNLPQKAIAFRRNHHLISTLWSRDLLATLSLCFHEGVLWCGQNNLKISLCKLDNSYFSHLVLEPLSPTLVSKSHSQRASSWTLKFTLTLQVSLSLLPQSHVSCNSRLVWTWGILLDWNRLWFVSFHFELLLRIGLPHPSNVTMSSWPSCKSYLFFVLA